MLMQDNNPPKSEIDNMITRVSHDIAKGFWDNGCGNVMNAEQQNKCMDLIKDQVAKLYFGIHPRLEAVEEV